MSSTRQLPRAEWTSYFERFTADHLDGGTVETATVEVVSPRLGDQVEFSDIRLLGLAFDPKSEALQVLLENVDHLIFHPSEIWVLEADAGENDELTIEVVGADGRKEIIYVRRSGPPAPRYDFAPDASSGSQG